MRERRQVVCLYGGHRLEVYPAILGFTRKAEKALVFQSGGDGDSNLPPGGEWRCLSLAGVTILELRDGPWLVPEPVEPQTCVTDVEYDINPASPHTPRFRL